MAIRDGKQLKRILRLGWAIIVDDPAISQANFNTELEATTPFLRGDWNDTQDPLTELGYLTGTETFSQTRTWVTDKTAKLRGTILDAVELFFKVSPSMQLALLQEQRTAIIAERNIVRDLIQDALTPFIDAAIGDQRVIDVVIDGRTSFRRIRDQLNDDIVVIDARIAELEAIIASNLVI